MSDSSNKPRDKTTEPGRAEYEAWSAWLRGPREVRQDELWENLPVEDRAYWTMVEKENGRNASHD